MLGWGVCRLLYRYNSRDTAIAHVVCDFQRQLADNSDVHVGETVLIVCSWWTAVRAFIVSDETEMQQFW